AEDGIRDFHVTGVQTCALPILVELGENIASLELFHGPTMAFKDVGARFMAQCLGHFSQGEKQEITVLVATSGDTGGAVANGFLRSEERRVGKEGRCRRQR